MDSKQIESLVIVGVFLLVAFFLVFIVYMEEKEAKEERKKRERFNPFKGQSPEGDRWYMGDDGKVQRIPPPTKKSDENGKI